jgi:hypothetical protein
MTYVVDTPVRAKVPGLLTTFWISFFFGAFGFIPALIHSKRAKALGAPVGKYWAVWLITWIGTYILVGVLF